MFYRSRGLATTSVLVVLLSLLALALTALPSGAQDTPALVNLSSSEELGPFMVDAEGMTLYIFDRDTLDKSNCSGKCLENWPALTVESADELSAAEGIPGELGTIEREEGTLQVTYNGWPLYYWVKDEAPGDTTGQAVGKVWWVMPPATVYVAGNEELGTFLVGTNGLTVYMFTNDEEGVSNCADECATNWPPLTVESEDDLVPGVNLAGELGTIERADGGLQVTYNGWPLYYFAKDEKRGDATGEGAGDVWYTIPPATVVVSSNEELGDFLVARNGFTLYTFKNDEAGVSNCADDCAKNWPPLTVGANIRLVGGEGVAGELATIERADGGLQVTYNGMPLYYFAKDAVAGDATGEGAGDVWFVGRP